jgi:hypothetical protein
MSFVLCVCMCACTSLPSVLRQCSTYLYGHCLSSKTNTNRPGSRNGCKNGKHEREGCSLACSSRLQCRNHSGMASMLGDLQGCQRHRLPTRSIDKHKQNNQLCNPKSGGPKRRTSASKDAPFARDLRQGSPHKGSTNRSRSTNCSDLTSRRCCTR